MPSLRSVRLWSWLVQPGRRGRRPLADGVFLWVSLLVLSSQPSCRSHGPHIQKFLPNLSKRNSTEQSICKCNPTILNYPCFPCIAKQLLQCGLCCAIVWCAPIVFQLSWCGASSFQAEHRSSRKKQPSKLVLNLFSIWSVVCGTEVHRTNILFVQRWKSS